MSQWDSVELHMHPVYLTPSEPSEENHIEGDEKV